MRGCSRMPELYAECMHLVGKALSSQCNLIICSWKEVYFMQDYGTKMNDRNGRKRKMVIIAIDVYRKKAEDLGENEFKQDVFIHQSIIQNDKDYSENVRILYEKKRDEMSKEYERIASICMDENLRMLSDIVIANQPYPMPENLEYYRRYFYGKQRECDGISLPQTIMVNEQNVLLAGYESYLLLKESGRRYITCYRTNNIKSLINAVVVRRYYYKDGELTVDNNVNDIFYYDLSSPVVPGDDVIIKIRSKLTIVKVEEVFSLPMGCFGMDKRVIRHACKQDFDILQRSME